MKINISLDTKSLNNAIKQLKKIRNQTMPKMVQDYLKRCCEWVKGQANKYLESSGIGANVISDIKKSSDIVLRGNGYVLTYGEKAAFIEFGVGLIGEGTYQYTLNPNLQSEWQYDIGIDTVGWHDYDIHFKNYDHSWIFVTDDEGTVDIKADNIMQTKKTKKGELSVRTKGNQATMFLYNAAMDFKSTGEYKKKWEEVKREYLK